MGEALARKMGWEFADTDRLMEESTGLKVPQLISLHGHVAFRQLETSVLQTCLNREHLVVATGGGLPAYHQNMERMILAGLTFWLNPHLEEMVRRIAASDGQRPMFAGLKSEEIMAKLAELMEQRRHFYEKAAFAFNGSFGLEDLYFSANQQLI
jgi:shikimate kinase